MLANSFKNLSLVSICHVSIYPSVDLPSSPITQVQYSTSTHWRKGCRINNILLMHILKSVELLYRSLPIISNNFNYFNDWKLHLLQVQWTRRRWKRSFNTKLSSLSRLSLGYNKEHSLPSSLIASLPWQYSGPDNQWWRSHWEMQSLWLREQSAEHHDPTLRSQT